MGAGAAEAREREFSIEGAGKENGKRMGSVRMGGGNVWSGGTMIPPDRAEAGAVIHAAGSWCVASGRVASMPKKRARRSNSSRV